MAGATALDVRGLTVDRGGSTILRDVSFACRSGEVTALLGRNGAGKTSTLLSILSLIPSHGAVTVGGTDVAGLRTFEIARMGVGYVPEDRDVFRELSVAENLKLAETRGDTPDYDAVYEIFPVLGERQRQAAGLLSGGEQQMLALARVMLTPKRLILIDEPTKGLSPRFVTEVIHVLERMAAHTTILLVEQNLRVVQGIAHRAVVLHEGGVAFDGAADDLLGDDELQNRLLGVSRREGSDLG